MSVLTVSVRPQQFALLAADGVSTDTRTGAVHSLTSEKIRVYPSLNCAIGITGIGKIEALMDWFMPGAVGNFDDLVDVLPELARHSINHARENNLLICNDIRSNIAVAGWSNRAQEFKAYRVVSYHKESQDFDTGEQITLEPWVAHEMQPNRIWSSCDPSPDASEACGLNEDLGDEDDGAVATRMVCAARQSSGKISTDGMGFQFNAGGLVQLALVERGHCRTWITHSWPEDVIGEPIDPTRGAILPDYMTEDAE